MSFFVVVLDSYVSSLTTIRLMANYSLKPISRTSLWGSLEYVWTMIEVGIWIILIPAHLHGPDQCFYSNILCRQVGFKWLVHYIFSSANGLTHNVPPIIFYMWSYCNLLICHVCCIFATVYYWFMNLTKGNAVTAMKWF